MTDGIESRHLRAMMVRADEARRTPELNRLLNAGDMLANCAFNLAQRDTVLDAPLRKTLDLCRREWDSARADVAKAAPISPIAGTAGSTDKGCDPADERAAFEAWAEVKVGPLLKDNHLGYFYTDVRSAWLAWQARASLHPASAPDPVLRELVAAEDAMDAWCCSSKQPAENHGAVLARLKSAWRSARAAIGQPAPTGGTKEQG